MICSQPLSGPEASASFTPLCSDLPQISEMSSGLFGFLWVERWQMCHHFECQETKHDSWKWVFLFRSPLVKGQEPSPGYGGGSLVAKSCPTLCNPSNCSPPGSSILGISQARILEWVAIAFPTGSSWPMDQTHVCLAGHYCIKREPKQVTVSPVCSPRRASWFLTWGVCGDMSKGRAGRVAYTVCPLLWWCWVHGQDPAFAPKPLAFVLGSSEVSFVSLCFCICCPEFSPITHAHNYFWSLRVSLYFVAWGDICPGTRTAAKGPRFQPVSDPAQNLSPSLNWWAMYIPDPRYLEPPLNKGNGGAFRLESQEPSQEMGLTGFGIAFSGPHLWLRSSLPHVFQTHLSACRQHVTPGYQSQQAADGFVLWFNPVASFLGPFPKEDSLKNNCHLIF